MALEERIELELSLRRHAALIPELSLLVAEHPFREQLRAQLMLALYRCGRQADALESYTRGRAALVEDLGIEPGPQLRRMQQAILVADPGLDLEPPPSAPGGRRPPPAGPNMPAPPGRRGSARASALAAILALAALASVVALTQDGERSPPRAQPQLISGPTWARHPPAAAPATLFGVTATSSSGRMPSFRVGAVRLWDSHTRWANVEPHRGAFRLVDPLTASSKARRGRPLPFVLDAIGGTPSWRAPALSADGVRRRLRAPAPPRRMADWDAFRGAPWVRRYLRSDRGIRAVEPRQQPALLRAAILPALSCDMTRLREHRQAPVDPRAIGGVPRRWASCGKPAAARAFMRRFALRMAAMRYCDVAAMKMHQRGAPRTSRRRSSALAADIKRSFHRAGVHKRLWNTGSTYNITLELAAVCCEDAVNYAVRF